MDRLHSDTIVAPITGAAPAAVAVIRLSGPNSWKIAGRIFKPWPSPIEPKRAIVGNYIFGEKGIALPFAQGSSYTGQQVVELSLHGGRASVRELLDACIRQGARNAQPGEFTLRAFLNGVIDLSQAEAVADLIEAQTVRELRLANLNLEGGLRRTATDLRDALVEELARIEATIDFSEEIGDYNFEAGAESFKSIFERTELLLRRGRTAHRTRQGVRVAIVGRPNAGKSSLLNAMIGINRAIVTDQPGTTRDTIEETVDWNGLRVILIDTAGLRDATDQIERLGITRTLDETRRADEVLYVYDAVVGWTDEDERVLSMIDRHVTVVGNKADLADPSLGLKVSALYDNGLTEVIESITERYCAEEFAPTNERQSAHIELASRAVEGAWKASNTCQPIELVGVLVKEAIDQLGLVVGFTASEDMLEGIFSRFCIGK